MGRRPKVDSEAVSLFPFLSIIACVIGTLTLIITAVSLGQIEEGQSEEAKQVNKDYEKTEEELALLKEEIEKLKKLLKKSKSLEEELAAALAELKKLEEEEKNKNKKKTDKEMVNIKLLAEANKLRERIAELKEDPAERKKELKELKDALAKLKEPPKAAVVQIKSGGSGINLDPYFVEVTKNSIRLLEDKNQPVVRSQDINKKDGVFHKLLDRIALKRRGTIILLVRPDAVSTYNTVRAVSRSHYSKGPDGKTRYCPVGKLPVSTQGKIDLSHFGK